MRIFLFITLFLFALYSQAQVKRIPIGHKSSSLDSVSSFQLIARIQNYNTNPTNAADVRNSHIDSPKAAIIVEEKNKFYINSLEGYETLIFSLDSFKQTGIIRHCFDINDTALFNEKSELDYPFAYQADVRIFCGKPVEGCLTHDSKYLWITYYRRSFDQSAIQPSAMAIIDTDNDSILRVMATGPLPKMIAPSPDGKYLAVTHWGDNTIGIIDISSDDPNDFHYIDHFVVENKLALNSASNTPYNRDQECGYCLRGTVFTPDSKYLLVGRMGGGGIAVFDMTTMEYRGTVWGMKTNVRHLLIHDDYLYLSANKPGFVQKAPLDSILATLDKPQKVCNDWQSVFVGAGARTIDITPDGKFIFVAVNNASKIAMIRTSDMKVVAESNADSYPVGLSVSKNGDIFIVTSQGRYEGGGNSVMIFEIH
ncbi:MAG: beta-propeller fold lactonase family protein [Bacteroidales bacterium]|nr:beta-propeller fold lactonase family protein [Bacteroidales bacterium]